MRCIDRETGHTLFAVPYYENQWPVPSGQESSARAEARAVVSQKEAQKSLARDQLDNEKPPKSTAAKPLQGNFFDYKFTMLADEIFTENANAKVRSTWSAASRRGDRGISRVDTEQKTSSGEHSEKPDSMEYRRLIMLQRILLELEVVANAGMTAPANTSHSSSLAASKVDLSLVCPRLDKPDYLCGIVEALAEVLEAHVIRFDATDFAELTSEYVGGDSDKPGSFSSLSYDVFDGYDAHGTRAKAEEEAMEDDDAFDDDDDEGPANIGPGGLKGAAKALFGKSEDGGRGPANLNLAGFTIVMGTKARPPSRTASTAVDSTWDEARLDSLLNSLLDAPKAVRSDRRPNAPEEQSDQMLRPIYIPPRPIGGSHHESEAIAAPPGLLKQDMSGRVAPSASVKTKHFLNFVDGATWAPMMSFLLTRSLVEVGGEGNHCSAVSMQIRDGKLPAADPGFNQWSPPKIVHIRDLKEISSLPIGQVLVKRLIKSVRKRRQAGERIIIVGTSDVLAPRGDPSEILSQLNDTSYQVDLPLRHMVVPPIEGFEWPEEYKPTVPRPAHLEDVEVRRRITDINTRHIASMLRRLRPADSVELFSESAQQQICHGNSRPLGESVMSQSAIHRIVLTAIGLAQTHARSEVVTPIHLGFAIMLNESVDSYRKLWADCEKLEQGTRTKRADDITSENVPLKERTQARMDDLRKRCNTHEAKLLGGVIDPANIKVGFKEVHAPPETIDALQMLTSLSLTRPDAFQYGILAQDRLTGLMLYGPSGTGKTLLAKAVAKECKATMLEVSGAQIYEKYVGEGEKMVRAVFSLAKKLSPCIVFIDEADAIFSSRNSSSNRNTHREIINQFLREWDGMENHNVFLMVASNRPYDMDDAVLRRLPRRLLVDLPTAEDRAAILRIHLRDEQLDDTVSFEELAKQTPFYSGSDLKNVCVAAALACVREENQLAERNRHKKDFKLPEKRTLSARHFELAIKEISASINDEMSSLTAIRKFDEKFGDSRSKKKKAVYGFGLGDTVVDESFGRVRQAPPP